MAIMFPENQVFFAAESEREMYMRLMSELPADVRVYYSVSWNSDAVDSQYMGEGDFIILDPNFGFIVLEVKGGYKIECFNGRWTLWETPSSFRKLSKSPYEQARASMHTFAQKYQEKYFEPIPVNYAFAVCFPHYNVDSSLCLEMNSTNTICQSDIQNGKLWDRLRGIFFAHKHEGTCTESDVRKLDTLFKGEAYNRISAGNIVSVCHRKFSEIGRVEDACLDLLTNYKQVMIVGSAGTGKTSIAIQKAIHCASAGMETLYVCYNRLVSLELTKELSEHGVTCTTFHRLVYNIIGETEFNHLASTIDLQGVLDKVSLCFPQRYDAIIVDEAQDFHEEWALTIRALLKDDQESLLYVFYDEEQNIFQRDFGEAFLINSPPFLLRRNLRNTENIWAFVVAETSLGSFSYSNGIAGVDPKCYPTKNRNKLFESITHQIRALTAEGVAPHSIVILSDRKLINTPLSGYEEIAGFHFVDGSTVQQSETLEAIRFYTVQSYKGLDADVVICLLSSLCSSQMRYVAYSRARCLLYVYEFNAEKYSSN